MSVYGVPGPELSFPGASGLGGLADAADQVMVVVTAGDGIGPDAGCLVGFHTQASITPWRYCVFISLANYTHRIAAAGDHLAIHLLDAGDQSAGRSLASIFGSLSGDDADKFSLCDWRRSPQGPPVLAGASGWMVGPIISRCPAGDHEAFIIEPTVVSLSDPLPPLLRYDEVQSLDPGHQTQR